MELGDELIMTGDEIESLFTEDNNTDYSKQAQPQNKPEDVVEQKVENKTTENQIDGNDIDDLFVSESVGSGNSNGQEGGDTEVSRQTDVTSPKTFYSSITSALRDEGIFPDLDDEAVKKIQTPEDFVELIENTINSKLDERQKRIYDALSNNVEPEAIRAYEQTLSNLDNITDDLIKDESEKGEALRKQLIYQDFLNRGYSKERAQREVKKSFDAGTDLEDAQEALKGNKEYFKSKYDSLLKEAEDESKQYKEDVKKEAESLKKVMLEDKEVFEGLSIDKSIRQKAYDNITKPVYKTEDGQYMTAIQKYAAENPVDFKKNLGILFTMTDGFKSLDKLIKGKVRREVSQSLRELEGKLKNQNNSSFGNPTFVDYSGSDPESSIRGWDIDLN